MRISHETQPNDYRSCLPTVDQVSLLKTAVLDMIEETLTGG